MRYVMVRTKVGTFYLIDSKEKYISEHRAFSPKEAINNYIIENIPLNSIEMDWVLEDKIFTFNDLNTVLETKPELFI